MIVLTCTLNLIQICKIIVHANSPCRNALKYSWIRVSVLQREINSPLIFRLIMTAEIAACIRIWMGGLITLFFSGVTAPQYRKNPPDWRWRFCRRRGLFGLKLFELVRLLMPERWSSTCKGLVASKCPNELIGSSAAHAPNWSVWLIASPGEKTNGY